MYISFALHRLIILDLLVFGRLVCFTRCFVHGLNFVHKTQNRIKKFFFFFSFSVALIHLPKWALYCASGRIVDGYGPRWFSCVRPSRNFFVSRRIEIEGFTVFVYLVFDSFFEVNQIDDKKKATMKNKNGDDRAH